LAFARLLAQHQVGVRDHVGEVSRRLENLSEWSYTDEEFGWRARQDALMRLRILKTLPTPKFLRRCAVVRMRRRLQRERENERDVESGQRQ
jgi:hypothetical protein